MRDADFDRWWKVHAAARDELTRIPGVVGVGLGIKEKAGKLADEVALIVYVVEKKPSSRVPPTELVPAQFRGMKTDVQRYQKVEVLGGTTLHGGLQIRRLPDDRDRPKPGTLGYIATKTSDNTNVMLSCEHVLIFSRTDERSVFHPDVSRCCGKLKHKVGTVIAGRLGNFSFNNGTFVDTYFVDAALASIDSGVTARKHIPNVGAIAGSGDLTASPTGTGSSTVSVKKMGAASGFTEGVVDDVAFPMGPAARTIRIRPVASGAHSFSIRWKVPPEDVAMHVANFPAASNGGTAAAHGTDEVDFHVEVFALPGDSGSAVVDPSGNIVGLIFTGSVYELAAFQHGRLGTGIVPTGFGIACHIPPVLEQLSIRIDPGTATIAGEVVLVPGDEVSIDEPIGMPQLNARIAALEAQLEESPAGRRLTRFIHDHAAELMELVHHSRRVMVIWHRSHGPAWVALFLRALSEPERGLPRMVKGMTLEVARERMYQVLMEHGSPELRAAMQRNREFVYGLVDASRSVNDLVAMVHRAPADDGIGVAET